MSRIMFSLKTGTREPTKRKYACGLIQDKNIDYQGSVVSKAFSFYGV